MIRRRNGLRQYQHAVQQFHWFHVDTKKLALASIATTLALSSGATLLTTPDTSSQPKPHAITPSSNTASHPLLDFDDDSTPLPGLSESTQSQPQIPDQDSPSQATDHITNGVMHETTITINGESIEIPPSGTSHQAIKNADGSQTDVDIQSEQTQVDGTPRSNIIIDSRSTTDNSPTSLNSRITITH